MQTSSIRLQCAPARDEVTNQLRVLRPEMIVGLLLEMATGDENMPKGGHADDLVVLQQTDEKQLLGPRVDHKRKKGEFGYGAHGDDPWMGVARG